MKILNKISVKTLSGGVDKNKLPTEICAIYGTANEMETKETPYGDAICFMGDFEGVDIATGEMARSGKVYLPNAAADLLAAALKAAQRNEQFAGLKFGFKISAVASDKLVGYEFSVQPLLEPVIDDSILELRNLAVSEVQKLEKKSDKKD